MRALPAGDLYEENVAKRGLPFDMVADFDFTTANFAIDDRRNYGEVRYQALGFIADRLYLMVFAPTSTGVRVISLRKANAREINRYEPQA